MLSFVAVVSQTGLANARGSALLRGGRGKEDQWFKWTRARVVLAFVVIYRSGVESQLILSKAYVLTYLVLFAQSRVLGRNDTSPTTVLLAAFSISFHVFPCFSI